MKLTEVFKDVFNRTDMLESATVSGLTTENYRTVIANWYSWYRGKVKKFHNFFVYNGQKKVNQERLSLGMGKKVCEDWASLLMNEKTDIIVDDKTTQEALNAIFENTNFWDLGNEAVEKSFALGMGALVVYVDNLEISIPEDGTSEAFINKDKAKIGIEFVTFDKMYPFTVENKEITECAFVSKRGEKVFISAHLLNEDKNYEIHNIAATQNKMGDLKFDIKEDYYVFNTMSPQKWFTVVQPNIANNIDISSPLGISIYANSIDNLKSIDIIYDSFASEFQLGRKRIYVSAEALKINQTTGEQTFVFDPNDTIFYALPTGFNVNEKPFVQETTGELRIEPHISGINAQLNILSNKVGLGENYYRFDKGGITTATQVISENSAMFRNLKRHEIKIEKALRELVRAIIYANNTFTANTSMKEDVRIEIKFDDSIIEDKNAEMIRDMQLVSQGLMAKWEFRVKWLNEDEETAKAFVAEHLETPDRIMDWYR